MVKQSLTALVLVSFGAFSGACVGEHAAPLAEGADVDAAQEAVRSYQVYNTGGLGVRVRSCPNTDADSPYRLSQGASVAIVCQIRGERVVDGRYASDVWDQLDDGNFVSDLYINTPGIGDFSPGIPQCAVGDPCY
ncbi:hypothetical protein WME99_38990 [Sorangium sp. So ce136]|uniref:hypothetical protein n=1 Tax=Sorangium sp. So ce136 TaxID=3133284 RepID=UPI003F07610F